MSWCHFGIKATQDTAQVKKQNKRKKSYRRSQAMPYHLRKNTEKCHEKRLLRSAVKGRALSQMDETVKTDKTPLASSLHA